jgi:hypothetical protein
MRMHQPVHQQEKAEEHGDYQEKKLHNGAGA